MVHHLGLAALLVAARHRHHWVLHTHAHAHASTTHLCGATAVLHGGFTSGSVNDLVGIAAVVHIVALAGLARAVEGICLTDNLTSFLMNDVVRAFSWLVICIHAAAAHLLGAALGWHVVHLVGLGCFPFLHGHAHLGSHLLVFHHVLGRTLNLAAILLTIAIFGSAIKHFYALSGLNCIHDFPHPLRRRARLWTGHWAWLWARGGRHGGRRGDPHLVHHLRGWARHWAGQITTNLLRGAATLLESAYVLNAFALFVGILDVTVHQCVGVFRLAARLARGAASVGHGFSASNLAADLECAARDWASARLHVCVQRLRWCERRCVNFFRSGSAEALGLLLHCLA